MYKKPAPFSHFRLPYPIPTSCIRAVSSFVMVSLLSSRRNWTRQLLWVIRVTRLQWVSSAVTTFPQTFGIVSQLVCQHAAGSIKLWVSLVLGLSDSSLVLESELRDAAWVSQQFPRRAPGWALQLQLVSQLYSYSPLVAGKMEAGTAPPIPPPSPRVQPYTTPQSGRWQLGRPPRAFTRRNLQREPRKFEPVTSDSKIADWFRKHLTCPTMLTCWDRLVLVWFYCDFNNVRQISAVSYKSTLLWQVWSDGRTVGCDLVFHLRGWLYFAVKSLIKSSKLWRHREITASTGLCFPSTA